MWYRVTQYSQSFYGLMGDQRILGFWGVTEILEIYRQYFQNIDRAFDLFTSNMTSQIRSYFDPKVQILSSFLKASKGYILDPTVDFKFET